MADASHRGAPAGWSRGGARRLAAIVLAASWVAACGGGGDTPPQGGFAYESGEEGASGRLAIAFLGDSLTAGLGLPATQSYPSVIEQMFHAEGYDEVEIINGGISGDTTAGGLRRVEQLLGPDVRMLVVALGANDALRGLTVAQTRENLEMIIDGTLGRGITVLLVGMEAPTNLGEDYRSGFRDVFSGLAADYRGEIGFIPFLLEGVAGDPALNQADGIHPNEQGARVIAERLYPLLRDFVDQQPPEPER